MIMSFDIWSHTLPCFEIYGTEGSLRVPDPNIFGGPVLLKTRDEKDWQEIALTHGYSENSRSLGLADMAMAIRSGGPFRANGEIAFHVLDIMQAVGESSKNGTHSILSSTCKQPEPMAPDLKEGELR